MIVEFGKAGWLAKARQQPDKVKMVVNKVRSDGLLPTIEAVRSKLDQPVALGYSNVGTVVEVGQGVTGFSVGDRVVSNGPHAEMVAVAANLCARVPHGVGDDEAAFAVVAAIALQGIRLTQPTLGEGVVVSGLGLIGLLAVQLLRAHGCRVLGLDFDPDKLDLARQLGAETERLGSSADPIAAARRFSRGNGADAVVITAATDSSEPVQQAAQMCRKRGRIVLVGVTGLQLSRAAFYEKELTFQVSCSYGPGRYDSAYEEKGQDYPIGFVRWTEQRNFEAVLDMMADGRIDVAPLVSHRFALERVADAYDLITSGAPSLGILLEYPTEQAQTVLPARTVLVTPASPRSGEARIGFVGAGNYALGALIPAFRASGAHLATVASSTGVSGTHAARKFGFASSTTDAGTVFDDPEIDALVIATRHSSHSAMVCRALDSDKHVFVEKPLALSAAELDAIEEARRRALQRGFSPVVTVGFNRRFAPGVTRMKALLDAVSQPKAMVMTVNAGAIPAEHWVHDREVGGGRIVGEACHFIDLLRFLANAPIVEIKTTPMASESGDSASIQLRFEDGSIGTVHYLANGSKAFPKERLDVFAGGKVLQLDNFRRLTAFRWPGVRSMKLWRQDKGQAALAAAFVAAIRGAGPEPIAFDELIEVSRAAISAAARI
jgi:predicted dehydrogenase/threonine dehydrogenase-like Zn-dependent dehydrogenase